jgi:Nitronate monooxygenase
MGSASASGGDSTPPSHGDASLPNKARRSRDGADGLVAQGAEVGGHLLGVEATARVLPRLLELAAGRPVLAAGGMASAADVRAALDVGATAICVRATPRPSPSWHEGCERAEEGRSGDERPERALSST